jgi:lysophospholipase L1-like esterase
MGLYGLVKDHEEYWSGDGVHFNSKGIAVEAEQVAKRIMENLK